MKIIRLKKVTILKICMLLVFTFTVCIVSKSFGMQHYYNLDFTTGIVTATTLNVRSGPGTNYSIVTTVKKNEYVRVFAGVGKWYIIQTDSDHIGAVSQEYVRAIYPSSSGGSPGSNTGTTDGNSNTTSLTNDELEVFNLINKQRTNNGLSALKIDSEVQNVAKIKAKDMVENNYFSHNSPIYGSPFDMLKSFKISYKTAGENIAGNSSNSGAVNSWMNSSGHKANILNSSFNYTGVGVVSSPQYGKVYVQIFIGK